MKPYRISAATVNHHRIGRRGRGEGGRREKGFVSPPFKCPHLVKIFLQRIAEGGEGRGLSRRSRDDEDARGQTGGKGGRKPTTGKIPTTQRRSRDFKGIV